MAAGGQPLAADLAARLQAGSPAAAEHARRWCADTGLPVLDGYGRTAADLPFAVQESRIADAAAALAALAAVRGDGSGLDLIRPLVAVAFADYLRRVPWPEGAGGPAPGRLSPLCGYARSVPAAEACSFAVAWAEQAWEAACRADAVRDRMSERWARLAIQAAALTISRILVRAGRPPRDPATYGEGAQGCRDLFTALAAHAPEPAAAAPAGAQSPAAPRTAGGPEGHVPALIRSAAENAAVWGFEPDDADRLRTLLVICNDFGQTLAPGPHPGAPWLRAAAAPQA